MARLSSFFLSKPKDELSYKLKSKKLKKHLLDTTNLCIIRAIGQKVLMTNPNKPDSYLNDVARSIQLHLPT